jgi:hypothetical protein
LEDARELVELSVVDVTLSDTAPRSGDVRLDIVNVSPWRHRGAAGDDVADRCRRAPV